MTRTELAQSEETQNHENEDDKDNEEEEDDDEAKRQYRGGKAEQVDPLLLSVLNKL